MVGKRSKKTLKKIGLKTKKNNNKKTIGRKNIKGEWLDGKEDRNRLEYKEKGQEKIHQAEKIIEREWLGKESVTKMRMKIPQKQQQQQHQHQSRQQKQQKTVSEKLFEEGKDH